jgi:hypothetical protein
MSFVNAEEIYDWDDDDDGFYCPDCGEEIVLCCADCGCCGLCCDCTD